MNILKSRSGSGDRKDQLNTRRRSFMRKLGAAIPAVLAVAVPGRSSSGIDRDAGLKNGMDRLSGRMGILEDENAIRRLHRNYEDCLDHGRFEDVPDLFADDGEVVFNGGIFRGKSGGIRRLFSECFKSGSTGRKIEPAPGFQTDTAYGQDSVKIAPDRKTAGASFPYSIQIGAPIISDSQLVRMARLHGEGIRKWWEAGSYEISYVKGAENDDWKIRRLEYRTLSKADYRPGKSHAGPISVPLFSKAYPEDPAGPDKLIDRIRET
jgi:hypothetical protein